MKLAIYCISLLLILCSCEKDATSDLQFTISPETGDSTALLKIKLTFKPDSDGTTTLSFQDMAWGQDSLHNVIHAMKLVDVSGEVTANREDHVIQLSHPENLETLSFEYLLKQDYEGPVTTRNDFRPIIQREYFHIFSHNLFMLPMNVIEATGDDFSVSLNWKDFPPDYKIINSLATNRFHN